MHWLALVSGLLLLSPLAASENQQLSSKKRESKSVSAPGSGGGLTRAAAVRNENVQVNRIDNDGLKESNIRLGNSVTLVPLIPVETSYFAAEHGRPGAELGALRPANPLSGWHGELFEFHRNSVWNARTFFQVGSVLPSRQNQY